MTKTNLSDLFLDRLRDIYFAEHKILKALPEMANAVGPESKLAAAFGQHFKETQGQAQRLEKIFELIGQKAKGKTCAAIEGIIEEGEKLMKSVDCKMTLEAGLLAGAQASAHYQIARYGTLVEWAKILGHHKAAELLSETLLEEKKTDQTLNDMAVRAVNQRALDAQKKREKESGHRRAA